MNTREEIEQAPQDFLCETALENGKMMKPETNDTRLASISCRDVLIASGAAGAAILASKGAFAQTVAGQPSYAVCMIMFDQFLQDDLTQHGLRSRGLVTWRLHQPLASHQQGHSTTELQ